VTSYADSEKATLILPGIQRKKHKNGASTTNVLRLSSKPIP
jgi:hypothetical protein